MAIIEMVCLFQNSKWSRNGHEAISVAYVDMRSATTTVGVR